MKSKKTNAGFLKYKAAAGFTAVALLAGMFAACSSGTAQAERQEYPPVPASSVNHVTIGQNLTGLVYERENGSFYTFGQHNTTPLIIVYWASWCPACQKDLAAINPLTVAVRQAGGDLVLANKLDGVKETWESALSWLQETHITTPTLFDAEAQNYNTLNLSMIPTLLAIDKNGAITGVLEGRVGETPEVLSFLAEAKAGKRIWLEKKIEETLLNGEGGMHTSYLPEQTSLPTGSDVLSESQGLLMLYAANTGNKGLFDTCWGYVTRHLTEGGLASWVVENGKGAPINALVDDFRIYNALHRQGKEAAAAQYADAIWQYGVNKKQLVDFYAFDQGAYAKRLTLCYADFKTMRTLAGQNKEWEDVLQNSLSIVENGVISKEFPLYYSWYDYTTKTYEEDDLNMAEGLLTLLHLSEIGRLPPEAYEWLRERILQDGYLYSRYTVKGKPAENGMYESTAVYALAAQIALSQGDLPLARAAVTRMDTLRIRDIENPLDGIFGKGDGTGIYSFDQLLALQTYQQIEQEEA